MQNAAKIDNLMKKRPSIELSCPRPSYAMAPDGGIERGPLRRKERALGRKLGLIEDILREPCTQEEFTYRLASEIRNVKVTTEGTHSGVRSVCVVECPP